MGQVVQIYCPGGISVDVGCSETLAFLEVEEIRIGRCTFFFGFGLFRSFEKIGGSTLTIQEFKDGFPDQGPFRFRVGETVHARVLDVNPSARTGVFWLFEPGGLDLDFCCLESHGNLVSRTEDHGEPDPFGEHGDTGALFTDFSIFLHFTHHSTTFRQDLEMVN